MAKGTEEYNKQIQLLKIIFNESVGIEHAKKINDKLQNIRMHSKKFTI